MFAHLCLPHRRVRRIPERVTGAQALCHELLALLEIHGLLIDINLNIVFCSRVRRRRVCDGCGRPETSHSETCSLSEFPRRPHRIAAAGVAGVVSHFSMLMTMGAGVSCLRCRCCGSMCIQISLLRYFDLCLFVDFGVHVACIDMF